jgi:hypothetical protein
MPTNIPPKRIVVRIKQKHIKKGMRESSFACPIAQALKEQHRSYKIQVGDFSKAGFFYTSACNLYGNTSSDPLTYKYKLSRSAKRFIGKFDLKGKKSVKPVTFIFTRV